MTLISLIFPVVVTDLGKGLIENTEYANVAIATIVALLPMHEFCSSHICKQEM
jgi:hypothetical protein